MKGNRAAISTRKGAKCHFFVISSFHGLFGSFLMDTVQKGFCRKNARGHARS
jgi:hypothetical protein